MEFWGVEVKVGEPVKVNPQDFEAYIHLSQAALGEAKKDKGKEPVVLYLKFGDQKLVLGTLSRENFPQISFDIVLEKEFELSHNSKTGSVYFCGYKAEIPDEDDDFDNLSDSEDDEDLPLITKDNGKPDAKTEVAKVARSKNNGSKVDESKKQVKVVDPKNDEEEESDDDDEDDEIGSFDEGMMDADSDSDEESESDEDDEETPTPKKVDQGKKRPNDSASKTPLPAKKAKSATPQKTDGKKGGHTATPHPMKKGGKSPNSEAKDPKSGGQLSCQSCSKSFTSGGGLEQHKKAKHGGQ